MPQLQKLPSGCTVMVGYADVPLFIVREKLVLAQNDIGIAAVLVHQYIDVYGLTIEQCEELCKWVLTL